MDCFVASLLAMTTDDAGAGFSIGAIHIEIEASAFESIAAVSRTF
jgi:hypothetical protein